AVQAAIDPVDLDAGPDRVPLVGVDEYAGDERRADGALCRGGHVEPLPLPSAVARAIVAGRPRPREEGVRVGRIDRERPDRRDVPLRADPLPGRPAVVTRAQT